MFLLCNDLFTAWSLQLLFRFQGYQRFTRALPITAVAIWTLLAVVLPAPRQVLVRKVLIHPVSMVISAALALALVGMSIPFDGQFGIRQFALYLFAVQALSVVRLVRNPDARRGQNWVSLASQFLVPLLAYGGFVYPHLRNAFGGGEAVTASIVTINKNGPFFPVERLTGIRIIDETDSGLYILQNDGKTVRYIPRSSVYSVEFAKPDSGFYQMTPY